MLIANGWLILKKKDMEELTIVQYCCMFNGCSKVFKTKFDLKWHTEKVHLKVRKFVCDICDKHFASKQNLKEHRFIHTGQKPYKCDLCGQDFRQYSFLFIHKRHHKYI